jgi:hypothetical protein
LLVGCGICKKSINTDSNASASPTGKYCCIIHIFDIYIDG